MSTPQPVTPREAIRLAALRAGSQEKLALLLNVSQATISKWELLPEKFVDHVERVLGISRHWLRPDLFPVELPASSAGFFGVDHGIGRVSFQNGCISQVQHPADAA